MTGTREWGLIRAPNGEITGVHSLSELTPLKQAGFPERFEEFNGAPSYKEWRFIYAGQAAPTN
jgi:hypothetical protein